MRGDLLVAALAGLLLTAGPVAADPSYRAEDIVKHFAPEPELGATRGLCIGTEAECAKSVAPPKATAKMAFDLVVNFEYNSDELSAQARQNLDEFAKAMRDARLSKASFLVEGHTDGKGSDSYNLSLSARRANAVVQYLAQHGVDASKLAAKGYGKAKPRVSDPFDPANRRVETRLRIE
jgi:outer membrane protein OmpA-like peptidoglycan-associated protein